MQWIDQLTIKKCLILTICISVLSLNPTKTKYYTIGLNPVEEKYPFALQKKIQDIFCLTLWSSLRLISSWYSETGEGLSLSVSRYCPIHWPEHHHQLCQLPYLGESRFTSTVARRSDTSLLLSYISFLFQMLILLCLLGSSLGAPQSYYFPSYSSYPTAYPTYNTFLGSGSFPRYYGAAAIPRTGFSYSFGPGYNFQWRCQFATTVLLTEIGCLAGVLVKVWTFCNL